MHRDGINSEDVGVGRLSSLNTVKDVAELRIAGGSGFGDPLERDFKSISNDLAQGYISADGAAKDYGCVIRKDGSIDIEASKKMRASLKA